MNECVRINYNDSSEVSLQGLGYDRQTVLINKYVKLNCTNSPEGLLAFQCTYLG